MKISMTTLGLLMAAGALAQTPAGPPAATTAEEWFKQHDVNQDGFLVKEEVKGTRTDGNFEKFDTDKDAKLSFAEYEAGREATEGAANSARPAGEGGGMGGGMGGSEAPPAN